MQQYITKALQYVFFAFHSLISRFQRHSYSLRFPSILKNKIRFSFRENSRVS